MYKELKTELENKRINEQLIKGKEERIAFKLQNQLGLKSSNISDAKIETVGITKNDKFVLAFASVEKLEAEVHALKQENRIIEKTIDKIAREIDSMDDNEKKVFKCRYILGLSRRATAERLSFSEDRIKQISREISKKM